MDFAFAFIAAFFILSACWFTPYAGTEIKIADHSKPLTLIAFVSVAISGFIGSII